MARRRLPRTLLTLTVLLAAGWAGCIQGEEAGVDSTTQDGEEPPSQVVVEPEPGVFVAENRGIVRGQVADDANFTVPGARVSIVGTERYQDADAQGKFRFDNVTVGAHRYRVERSGYQVAEGEFAVKAGHITELLVHLIPTESRGLGYKPHVHDYWGDRTEITLMDSEVDFTAPANNGNAYTSERTYPVTSRVYGANTNATYLIPLPEDEVDGIPPIILPGTGEIRVTFAWAATDVTLDRLGLSFVPADSTSAVALDRRASGQTWSIPVTSATMTDSGHQRFSLWEFYMYPGVHPVNSPTSWQPAVINGPVDVTIVLVKGELLPEPPHADYWQGRDVVQVLDKSDPYIEPLTFCNGCGKSGFLLKAPQLVPPGTVKIRVEFEWHYNMETPADLDYGLVWRSADQPRQTTRLDEFHRADPIEEEPYKKVYEFDVDPWQTDAFYQARSNWLWAVRAAGFEDENFILDRPSTRTFTANIFVYRDPGADPAA